MAASAEPPDAAEERPGVHLMATKSKGPRLFVSVPWREMLELYVRVRGPSLGSKKGGSAFSTSITELVETWGRHIGEPRGFRVRRWRYDENSDRVVLDLDWQKARRVA